MATGGWKWSEWVYMHGTYGSKGSLNARQWSERQANSIIKGAAQAIINSGEGWAYDSEFTAGEDDFTSIGTNSDWAYYVGCQFLKHANGARLCIRYTVQYRVMSKVSECKFSSAGDITYNGLCMSIIPPGSANKWDLSSNGTTENFLPYDATRFVGNSRSTGDYSAYSNVSADYKWSLTDGSSRYVFGIKADSVFFGVNQWIEKASSKSFGLSFVGELFGQLANDGDSAYFSKYGAFTFATGSNEYAPSMLDSMAKAFVGPYQTYFRDNAKAIPPSGLDDSSFSMKCFNTNASALYSSTTNAAKSGKVIFGAVGAYIQSIDALTYGVSNGNGMKGYFDTDKFRIVYPAMTSGTLLDGGRFIYFGGGFSIGWDASNTITLRD